MLGQSGPQIVPKHYNQLQSVRCLLRLSPVQGSEHHCFGPGGSDLGVGETNRLPCMNSFTQIHVHTRAHIHMYIPLIVQLGVQRNEALIYFMCSRPHGKTNSLTGRHNVSKLFIGVQDHPKAAPKSPRASQHLPTNHRVSQEPPRP